MGKCSEKNIGNKMILLDSKDKKKWKLIKSSHSGEITLSRGGLASSAIEISCDFDLNILFKNKSGDGIFWIKIFDEKNKLFFQKKLRAKNGGWSDFSEKIKVPSGLSSASILLEKPASSFGRVSIGRLKVASEAVKKKPLQSDSKEDLSNSKFSFFERKKSLAVIVPYGIYGGAEVYLKNIFKNNTKNIDIDFLLFKNNKISDYLDNVNFITLHSITQLPSFLELKKYDSIVFYNSKNIYNILKDLKRSKKIDSQLVEIYHSDFKWSDSLSYIKNREQLDKLIRVSDGLANDIAGDFVTKTIPVSFDTDTFSKKRILLKRKHIGVLNSNPIFGLVARLSPEKNIDYAIDLFKDLNHLNLVIFGNGPLLNKLILRVKNESIKNVKIMLHKPDIENYYNLFDAFILTSKMEGTPLTIVEALAYNLPVFTTDVGGIKDHFSECSAINFLFGNLKKDKEILDLFSKNMTIHPDAREFVLKNHCSKINSDKFFNFITGNNINFEKIEEDCPVIRGEWL